MAYPSEAEKARYVLDGQNVKASGMNAHAGAAIIHLAGALDMVEEYAQVMSEVLAKLEKKVTKENVLELMRLSKELCIYTGKISETT
jgi:hypothetical protein